MRMLNLLPAAAIAVLCAQVVAAPTPASAMIQCGGASWYAMTSRTASGERASPNTMTAAHRSLPFGTKVRVTNLRNGRTVMVRVNDRGPFVGGRIIDVTRAAATKLGFVNAGVARVKIEASGAAARSRASSCT